MVPPEVELPHFYRPDHEFALFLEGNFPRGKFAEFREFLDQGAGNPFPLSEMYTYLRETREALRMIATHQKERSLFTVNFYFPWEKVSGWKVDRIRICANCKKLFFAARNNKLTCSDPCSTARRVREWRKHQPQYEQARKLKQVRPTKDSKIKIQKQKESSSRKQGSKGAKNVSQKTR
jgi:hypothetical protein